MKTIVAITIACAAALAVAGCAVPPAADAQSLNAAKRAHALADVALYRALGGGWSTQAVNIAASPKETPVTSAATPDSNLRVASSTR